tara:strand:+ start:58009 stop:58275 length:267 start_codon:yes stop_codon:yes gene_type:complete
MSLSVVDLYDKGYISKLGNEYVCTGFMFDMYESDQDLQSQLSSFDLVGVTSGQSEGAQLEEDYNMSPTGQGAGYSAGGSGGGMGGGSY